MRSAAFLCPSPYEIGTYHRAFAIARHLVRARGWQVDLVCTGDKDETSTIAGVNVVRTRLLGPNAAPMRGWNPGEIVKRLLYFVGRRKRYDLVYSFEYQPNVLLIASPLARLSGAPHFNDWCDWYAGRHHQMRGIKALQRIDHFLEEFPRPRFDCVTTICQSLYDRALKCGVPPGRLLLIREGADGPAENTPRETARRKLDLPTDAFVLVTMADASHKIVGEALAALRARRPEARLVAIGKFDDRLEVEGLSYPGRVSNEDLHLWLSAADAAWQPLEDIPLNEGRLPHKIGHFRMYGLPVVTSRVSDLGSIRDPGLILTEYSARAIADATSGLAPLSDAARAASQVDARAVFDWDRVLEPLMARIAG